MSNLEGTLVRRGGVTANRWYETISDVSVESADTVRIRFAMASKGGGDTQVQLEIPSQSFPAVLRAMAEVDRDATLEAASLELARQLSSASARQKAFDYEGEWRVVKAARKKYHQKEEEQSEEEEAAYRSVLEAFHSVILEKVV